MTTHLILVRHGESTWNVEGRYQGQADPPLTERGRAQAEAVASELTGRGLTAIYSSPLRRAADTAAALVRATGLPVQYDPHLMEIGQGAWEGQLGADVERRWPELLERWRHAPWTVTLPGGETLATLRGRVLAALADVVARHRGQRVAIVAHQLPIAIVRIEHERRNPADIWSLTPDNGAWLALDVGPEDVAAWQHRDRDGEALRRAFEAKAAAWDAYTATPAGRLREALNWRYLLPHLPPNDGSAPVLDAGGGTGGLAVRLAQHGYHVHVLDLAEAMLERARQRAAAAGVGARVVTVRSPVEELRLHAAPGTFAAVACHTLLEYVADPAAVVETLADSLQPGGILSLVFVNRYADPLRLALLRGDFAAARAALDAASSPADLFGVPRRTFDSEAVHALLARAGIAPLAEYGVRVFADLVSHDGWHHDSAAFAALVELEAAAAPRLPFRHIGRYGQIIGCKPG